MISGEELSRVKADVLSKLTGHVHMVGRVPVADGRMIKILLMGDEDCRRVQEALDMWLNEIKELCLLDSTAEEFMVFNQVVRGSSKTSVIMTVSVKELADMVCILAGLEDDS